MRFLLCYNTFKTKSKGGNIGSFQCSSFFSCFLTLKLNQSCEFVIWIMAEGEVEMFLESWKQLFLQFHLVSLVAMNFHFTLPFPHGLQILIGPRCKRRGTWGDHWSRWFVGNCLPVRTLPWWTAGLPAPLRLGGKPAGGMECFSCWQINALPSWL